MAESLSPKPDISPKAFEKAMEEFGQRGLPKQSYEDWKLFLEQDNLRTLYVELLHINPEKVRAERRKGEDEYWKAFEVYKKQNGITNNTPSGHSALDDKVYREFLKKFRTTHKVPASQIVIVWEMWAEFQDAEIYFRENMKKEQVQPKDAFKALWLSNRHRQAIGQWEQSPSKYKLEGVTFEKSNIDISRKIASKALDSFSPSNDTPFSFKLAAQAREEIEKSIEAESKKQFDSAFQWASDAAVTAGSAKALHEL